MDTTRGQASCFSFPFSSPPPSTSRCLSHWLKTHLPVFHRLCFISLMAILSGVNESQNCARLPCSNGQRGQRYFLARIILRLELSSHTLDGFGAASLSSARNPQGLRSCFTKVNARRCQQSASVEPSRDRKGTGTVPAAGSTSRQGAWAWGRTHSRRHPALAAACVLLRRLPVPVDPRAPHTDPSDPSDDTHIPEGYTSQPRACEGMPVPSPGSCLSVIRHQRGVESRRDPVFLLSCVTPIAWSCTAQRFSGDTYMSLAAELLSVQSLGIFCSQLLPLTAFDIPNPPVI